MDFKFLGSSSKGNCGVLRSKFSTILIDAGLSGKKIIEYLTKYGIAIDEIDAIFITHEHADHCQGLRGLAKNDLKIYTTRGTALGIEEKYNIQLNWQLFSAGDKIYFRDMEIGTFSIPHDANEPVGYVFRFHANKKSLAWVTDLGYVPDKIAEIIKKVNLLVLEANYDPYLLHNDNTRPIYIKKRIMGRNGHLSNNSAIQLIAETLNPAWEKVFLAHLSRDCNHPSAIKKIINESISGRVNFDIEIVEPDCALGLGYSM
ncbi:MAG: MBL fold metallo-hydrolase [Puniceicoccales bacterium]|nr:MBL fold metallo-hydrolase [Puniceicoccales bacterium]